MPQSCATCRRKKETYLYYECRVEDYKWLILKKLGDIQCVCDFDKECDFVNEVQM